MLVYVCAAFLVVDLTLYFVEIPTCKNRFEQQTDFTPRLSFIATFFKRLVYTGICIEMKSSKSCDKTSRPSL